MQNPIKLSSSVPEPTHNPRLLRLWHCLNRTPSHLLIMAILFIFLLYDSWQDFRANQVAIRPGASGMSLSWLDGSHLVMILLIGISSYRAIGYCLRTRRELKQHEEFRSAANLELETIRKQLKLTEVSSHIRRLGDHLLRTRSELRAEKSQPSPKLPEQSQEDKLSTLGRIVAGIAHEVNTPLGVALTATSVVDKHLERMTRALESNSQEPKAGEPPLDRSVIEKNLRLCREANQLIKPTIQKATELIQGLKQFTVAPHLAVAKKVNLSLVIADHMNSLRLEIRRAGHRIVLEMPELLIVTTRPDSLWQILSNLSMNSLTHGFAPGESGMIRIKAFATDFGAVIEFSDTGVGIPPENRERIFEPFYTTARQKGGSGLGLSIVLSLTVQSLDGTISYEDNQPHGAKFVLNIRNLDDSAAKHPKPLVTRHSCPEARKKSASPT
ncbi:MAG: HAMP domain-containing sensor histidine kinase [Alphaproteobacteria bacterium]|nr:HAMP domain-containing sensor histidine kinase [Alphaproteobacteria bacterium]